MSTEQPLEPYARLAGVYDEIVVDPCFALWAQFLDDLWSSDVVGVTAVLDVCCGTGLMAAELIPRGYDVVGIDASTAMLARAGRLLGPQVTLLEQRLPRLDIDGTFDAAISTFDGLNYLTADDFTTSIAAIAARLRPGGWLVFDLHTEAMLAYVSSHTFINGETDGNAFVITSDVDLEARTCNSRIVVTRDGESFAEDHLQYFHDDRLVHRALADAGLATVGVVDEYTDVSASSSTLRATWIARRR